MRWGAVVDSEFGVLSVEVEEPNDGLALRGTGGAGVASDELFLII